MFFYRRLIRSFSRTCRSLHICVLAGEPSGDEIGSRILQALCVLGPRLNVSGVGGHYIESELPTFQSIFPMSDLTVMGTTELVTSFPLLTYRAYQLIKHIVVDQPDVVLTVDSKGMFYC